MSRHVPNFLCCPWIMTVLLVMMIPQEVRSESSSKAQHTNEFYLVIGSIKEVREVTGRSSPPGPPEVSSDEYGIRMTVYPSLFFKQFIFDECYTYVVVGGIATKVQKKAKVVLLADRFFKVRSDGHRYLFFAERYDPPEEFIKDSNLKDSLILKVSKRTWYAWQEGRMPFDNELKKYGITLVQSIDMEPFKNRLMTALGSSFEYLGGEIRIASGWQRFGQRYWFAKVRAKRAGIFTLSYGKSFEVSDAHKKKDLASNRRITYTIPIRIIERGIPRILEPIHQWNSTWPFANVGDTLIIPIHIPRYDKQLCKEAYSFAVIRNDDRRWAERILEIGYGYAATVIGKDIGYCSDTNLHEGCMKHHSENPVISNVATDRLDLLHSWGEFSWDCACVNFECELTAYLKFKQPGEFNLAARLADGDTNAACEELSIRVLEKDSPVTVFFYCINRREEEDGHHPHSCSMIIPSRTIEVRVGDRIVFDCLSYKTPFKQVRPTYKEGVIFTKPFKAIELYWPETGEKDARITFLVLVVVSVLVALCVLFRCNRMRNIVRTPPSFLLIAGWGVFLVTHGTLLLIIDFLSPFLVEGPYWSFFVFAGLHIAATTIAVVLVGVGTWNLAFRLRNRVVSLLVFLVAIAVQLTAGGFLFVGMLLLASEKDSLITFLVFVVVTVLVALYVLFRRNRMRNIFRIPPSLLIIRGWGVFLITHATRLVIIGFVSRFFVKGPYWSSSVFAGLDIAAITIGVVLVGVGTWNLAFRLPNKVVGLLVFLVAIAAQLTAGGFLFVGMLLLAN